MTGGVVWEVIVGGGVLSSPAVAGRLLYVGSSDGSLYAIERSSGQVAWSLLVGDLVWTSPAVIDGVVYFGAHDGNIYAVRGTGKEQCGGS